MTIGIALTLSIFVLCGCAKNSLYKTWAEKIAGDPAVRTSEDISLLVGAPPYKCETVEPSSSINLGCWISEELVVFSAYPTSPAIVAGINIGDRILKVNNIKVENREHLKNIYRSFGAWEKSLLFETDKGTFNVVFKKPKEAKQCYWDVNAGTVVNSQGYAYVDPLYGGGASQSSSQRNRFFKTSVRFYDGFKIDANSNWQE
jgi:hypothetical protein